MQSIKQEAINAFTILPDNAAIDDIMYRLYVISKIKRGLEAIDNGEIITIDELQKEIASW